MRLAGKTAFVAGAASGIGKAVAAAFVQQGASVIAADIDLVGVRAAAKQLGNTTAVALDVADPKAWESAFHKVDRLDIFVLAAGISHTKPLTEMTLDEWRRVMAVNLDGAFLGAVNGQRSDHDAYVHVLERYTDGQRPCSAAHASGSVDPST